MPLLRCYGGGRDQAPKQEKQLHQARTERNSSDDVVGVSKRYQRLHTDTAFGKCPFRGRGWQSGGRWRAVERAEARRMATPLSPFPDWRMMKQKSLKVRFLANTEKIFRRRTTHSTQAPKKRPVQEANILAVLRQSTAVISQGFGRKNKMVRTNRRRKGSAHLVVDEAGVLINLVREALEVNARCAYLRRGGRSEVGLYSDKTVKPPHSNKLDPAGGEQKTLE